MWIGARGLHGNHILHEIGFAIAGGIFGPENAAALGEVYPVIGTDTGIHAHVQAFIKNGPLGFPVFLGGKHQHSVAFRSLIILRPEMCMAFNHQHAAFRVHTQAGGRDDVRGFRHQLYQDPGVRRFWGGFRTECQCWECKKKGGLFHGETGAIERIRTVDLLITSELLYQLSYNGAPVNLAVSECPRKKID